MIRANPSPEKSPPLPDLTDRDPGDEDTVRGVSTVEVSLKPGDRKVTVGPVKFGNPWVEPDLIEAEDMDPFLVPDDLVMPDPGAGPSPLGARPARVGERVVSSTLAAYALNLLAGAVLEDFERTHLLELAAARGVKWSKSHDALVAGAAARHRALEDRWRDIAAAAERRALAAGRPNVGWQAMAAIALLAAGLLLAMLAAVLHAASQPPTPASSGGTLWNWESPGLTGTILELGPGERATLKIFPDSKP